MTFFISIVLICHPFVVLAKNILVLGDSISAAYGIQPKEGWAALLQQKIINKKYDYKIINASISGDTTGNALTRLSPLLKHYQPTIVLVELGGNDGLRGFNLARTEENLAQIIEKSQASGAKVLLLGITLPPNYGPQYIQQFTTMFKSLAKKHKISLVVNIVAGIENDLSLLQADGIHPTAKAQPLILRAVWGKLDKLLQ